MESEEHKMTEISNNIYAHMLPLQPNKGDRIHLIRQEKIAWGNASNHVWSIYFPQPRVKPKRLCLPILWSWRIHRKNWARAAFRKHVNQNMVLYMLSNCEISEISSRNPSKERAGPSGTLLTITVTWNKQRWRTRQNNRFPNRKAVCYSEKTFLFPSFSMEKIMRRKWEMDSGRRYTWWR